MKTIKTILDERDKKVIRELIEDPKGAIEKRIKYLGKIPFSQQHTAKEMPKYVNAVFEYESMMKFATQLNLLSEREREEYQAKVNQIVYGEGIK